MSELLEVIDGTKLQKSMLSLKKGAPPPQTWKESKLAENTIQQLKAYFSNEDNPVSNTEMMEFWKSLTDEEKRQLKEMGLS